MRCNLVYAAEHDAGSDDYDGRKGGAAAKAMAAGNRAEDEVGKTEKEKTRAHTRSGISYNST